MENGFERKKMKEMSGDETNWTSLLPFIKSFDPQSGPLNPCR
jgi:hypothetical protein